MAADQLRRELEALRDERGRLLTQSGLSFHEQVARVRVIDARMAEIEAGKAKDRVERKGC